MAQEFYSFTELRPVMEARVKSYVEKHKAALDGESPESVITSITKSLFKLSENFKYLVSGQIIEKKGLRMSHASSSWWNTDLDGTLTSEFDLGRNVLILTIHVVSF